jgi:integrase
MATVSKLEATPAAPRRRPFAAGQLLGVAPSTLGVLFGERLPVDLAARMRGGQQKQRAKEQSLARKRYQQGSLLLRGKRRKQWVLRWREDVEQADGSRKRVERKTVLGTQAELPTAKLARRRAEHVLARVNSPDYRAIKTITLAEFSELWRARVLSQRKPYTQKSANYHLRAFLLPKLGKLRLDQIGLGEVQGMVSGMAVGRHSILNAIGTLHSMLSTARKWGYLAAEFSSRDLVIPQRTVRSAKFFTPEQARLIIESAPQPWKSLYAIAAMCGLRPGEVLALAWEDIGEMEIRVSRSSCFGKLVCTKTKGSASTVPLPEPLREILNEYRRLWKPNAEHLLFATRNGRPHTTNKIGELRLYPLLRKLGIPQCGLNGFRHTHASLLLSSGASPVTAQRQLRHADPLTTLRNYAHIIGSEQRDATNRVAEILRPNSATKAGEPVLVQ